MIEEKTKQKEDLNAGMNNSNSDIYMGEADISVSLTSYMAAFVFFFIGILLTGSPDLQIRLRIPLSFLFLSAFGFLFSTLIYANASGEIARLGNRRFHRQMSLANIMSEYFGVYCLVFSIPLTVLGYSPDKFLSIIVFIISILGFLFYHLIGCSILDRYSSKPNFYYIISFLIIFQTLTFYTFYIEKILIYSIFSIITFITIFYIFLISINKQEV